MAYSHGSRFAVLEIQVLVDISDTDIEQIVAVKLYRTWEDYKNASNGYTPARLRAGSAASSPMAFTGGIATSIGAANVAIVPGEVLPPPDVIVITLTTQA